MVDLVSRAQRSLHDDSFNHSGWNYALSIWTRIFKTRGPEVGYNQLFRSGRCAFVIHYVRH